MWLPAGHYTAVRILAFIVLLALFQQPRCQKDSLVNSESQTIEAARFPLALPITMNAEYRSR